MPRLRYSAASKEDLKEIARFIAKDKPHAARQWLSKLREKCLIYFREQEGNLEIVRVVRGDLEFPFL